MVRKNYPFHKRDFDKGNKLISGLLTTLITLPVFLLNDIDAPDKKLDVSAEYASTPIKPKTLNIIHVLCGFFYFLGPLLFVLLIHLDWWLFWTIIVTFIYECIFAIPLIDFACIPATNNNVENSGYEVKILEDKYVIKIWIFIFIIHSMFYIAFCLLQWWAMFNPEWNDVWHPTLDLSYEFIKFLSNITDIMPISFVLIITATIANIYITIYLLKLHHRIAKNH